MSCILFYQINFLCSLNAWFYCMNMVSGQTICVSATLPSDKSAVALTQLFKMRRRANTQHAVVSGLHMQIYVGFDKHIICNLIFSDTTSYQTVNLQSCVSVTACCAKLSKRDGVLCVVCQSDSALCKIAVPRRRVVCQRDGALCIVALTRRRVYLNAMSR